MCYLLYIVHWFIHIHWVKRTLSSMFYFYHKSTKDNEIENYGIFCSHYFVHLLLFLESYISVITAKQCFFPSSPPGIPNPPPAHPTQDILLSLPLLDYILLHQQITTSKISHGKFVAIKQYLYKYLNTSLIRQYHIKVRKRLP